MATDLATLGLRVRDEGGVATIQQFGAAAERAATSGARLEGGTGKLSAELGRLAGHGMITTSALEGVGKKFEHLGVMGAFAITNLANGAETGFARLMHSVAMLGFSFGPLVGTITTSAAVIGEQLENLYTKETKRAEEFGKGLVDAIRHGQAEALAGQQKTTVLDLGEAETKLAALKSGFLPNRKAVEAAADDVARLRNEYDQLTKALTKAAERQDMLAPRSGISTVKIVVTDEAAAVRALAESYDLKTAATQRELAFSRAHLDVLTAQIKATRELAELQRKVTDAESIAESNRRLKAIGQPGTLGIQTGMTPTPSMPTVFGVSVAELDAFVSLRMQAIAKAEKLDHEAFQRRQAAVRAEIEKELEIERQLRENFTREWQDALSRGIAGALNGGLTSWRAFFSQVGSMWADMAGAWGAQQLMKSPLGSVIQGPLGLIGGGIAAFVTSAMDSADRMAEARAKFEGERKAWLVSLHDFANQFSTSDFTKQQAALFAQAKALADQMLGAAGNLGIKIPGADTSSLGGMQALIAQLDALANVGKMLGGGGGGAISQMSKDLQELIDHYAKNAELLREQQTATIAITEQELQIRRVRAQGLDEEAARLEQIRDDEREIAAYEKQFGADSPLIQELREIQKLEHERTEQLKQEAEAARKAAEATAALLKAHREAAEGFGKIADEIKRYAQAIEDLDVRGLAAGGNDAGADALRFELAQKRELDDAIKAYGADSDYVKKLIEVLKAEKARHDAQVAAAAASGVGGGIAPSTDATATGPDGRPISIAAGAIGRLNTQQGDRLVDEMTTSRILLSLIAQNTRETADNTRDFGRRMSSTLARGLSDASTLAGSSLVT